MSNDPTAIVPVSILTENKTDIINNWLTNIQNSPLWAHRTENDYQKIKDESEYFYQTLVTSIKEAKIPDLSATEFRPVIDLLKKLTQARLKLGYAPREAALILLTLKKSFLDFVQQHYRESEYNFDPQITEFSNLIDLLGLITLETITQEQETLIYEQEQELTYLREEMDSYHRNYQFIGRSPAMTRLIKVVKQVINTNATVLIEGESGVGKELIARLIHFESPRKNKPFVTINCAAIPETLMESELFGYEKGSFTGADNNKIGKFEKAHGGTLFLDEVGEMSPATQVKLLRALQSREIQRVGSNDNIAVDVRIVAATNKNLKDEVDQGTFRLDLFYRLNVFPIRIPPLRERPDDIFPLAMYFLERYKLEFNKNISHFSDDALRKLRSYAWPGNVRELENIIARAVILSNKLVITSDLVNIDVPYLLDLKLLPPPEIEQPSIDTNIIRTIIPLEDLEKQALHDAIAITNGNIVQAAKALGISRTTFYNKARKFGISDVSQDEQ